jgi:hypothetical protein
MGRSLSRSCALGTVLMARVEEDWMRVTGARKAMRRAGRQRKRVALRARILRGEVEV